jgi:hypothetical protein
VNKVVNDKSSSDTRSDAAKNECASMHGTWETISSRSVEYRQAKADADRASSGAGARKDARARAPWLGDGARVPLRLGLRSEG